MSASKANGKALVEVDIGKLETYLASIKEQLVRHEDELHSPVWWPAFKAEIDQVAVLDRKFEHQQQDINALKDLIINSDNSNSNNNNNNNNTMGDLSSKPQFTTYNSNSSSNNNKQNSSKLEKKTAMLTADLEGMKLLIRRLESQKAAEHNVYGQIRELQRCMRSMQQLVEERAPADALKTLMNLVTNFQTIKPLFDNRLQMSEEYIKKEMLEKAKQISSDISQNTYDMNRSKEILCVPKSEYNVKMMKVHNTIDGVMKELEDFKGGQSTKDFLQGKRTVTEVIKRRMTQRQRDLLTRWKIFTLYERKIANEEKKKYLNNFMSKTKKNLHMCAKYVYFQEWVKRNNMIKSWELYRIRVAKMIQYWISRVKPDIKLWLLRWKSQTVLSRSMIQRDIDPVTGEEIKINLMDMINEKKKQIQDLPDEDLTSKITVLKETVLNLADDLNTADNYIIEHTKSYNITKKTIESNKDELTRKIENQCAAIMTNLGMHSNSMIVAMSKLRQDFENKTDKDIQIIRRIDEEAESSNIKISKIQATLKDHNNKFDRIFLLQGEMMTRIEKLEENWAGIHGIMSNCIEKSESASNNADDAVNTTSKLNKEVKDSLIFYNDEFISMKKTGKIAHQLVEETAFKHRDIMEKLNEMERSIYNRLNDADDTIHNLKPPEATPEELENLCNEFEQVVIIAFNNGIDAKDVINEEHILIPLSEFVIRLAKQMSLIIRKVHVDKAIGGPRLAPPMSDTNGDGDVNGYDYGNDIQSEIITKFDNEFVRLLRQRDDEPGYARAQARVVFHRRFISALNIALKSYIPKESNGNGSTGKNTYSPGRASGGLMTGDFKTLARPVSATMSRSSLNSPPLNSVPPKWKPKIETDIIIQDDFDRSKTDYDYLSMSIKKDQQKGKSKASEEKSNLNSNSNSNENDNDNERIIPKVAAMTMMSPGFTSTSTSTSNPYMNKTLSMMDRQHLERSSTAPTGSSSGALRHRTAVSDSHAMKALVKASDKLIAAKNNKIVVDALTGTFEPSHSIPYDRSATNLSLGQSNEDSFPLQSRKLASNIY
jgi:hypothetical protein